MQRRFWKQLVLLALVAVLLAPTAILAQSTGEPGRGTQPNPFKNVYFGEQHLHTQDSPDAFAMGTQNSQDDAFNFCKGKLFSFVVCFVIVSLKLREVSDAPW